MASAGKVNGDKLGLFLCDSPFDFCHIIRPRELTSVPMSIFTVGVYLLHVSKTCICAVMAHTK